MKEIEEVKWQKECQKIIKDKDNIILSSPTGTGKTIVFLEWALSKKQRPIYITSPIKSLSNQRYRDLKKLGYVVGIETGDVKRIPQKCEFICCTQEIYTNKYVNENDVTLIIDEFHYIFENSDRARTYIDGLKNSKAKNICLCSATLGDTEKLEKYINSVTNRVFYTYINKKRLTELVYKQRINKKDIKNALVIAFSKKACTDIANIIEGTRNKKEKDDIQYKKQNIFRFDKIKELVESNNIDKHKLVNWSHFRYGIATYYSSLLPFEKKFIEQLFEQNLIDTVVGTDALALGVNFPIKNVVFTELTKKFNGEISKNMFEQLAGRAGRKGYFDVGKIYFCTDFDTNNTNLSKTYNAFLNKKNEELNIRLSPQIKKILKNEVSIEDETEYISKYSIPNLNTVTIKEEIEQEIAYINNFDIIKYINARNYSDTYDLYFGSEADEEYERPTDELKEKEDYYKDLQIEFNQNIANVYFEEYDKRLNCNIFENILEGFSEQDILCKNNIYDFYGLLQFRKYVKQLPKKYRKNISLEKIENKIREIDNSVFKI